MGRSYEVIRTSDLARLFPFFGIDAEPSRVEAHRAAIQSRFALEVQSLTRLCARLPERVRFQLFREALRLAYESALVRAGAAVR
jgi:hypothetical protein